MSRNSSRTKTVRNGTVEAQALPERQEEVAVRLACGQTVAAAAREVTIGATTIWRWMREDDAFTARVATLRKELTDRAVGRLADLMATTAADALKGLLGAKSEAVRLDAVRAVYELFVNVTDAVDLKGRIEALEKGNTP